MAFDLKATTRTFFDRQKVQNLADKKNRAAQAKFGAFVRRRAKSSIRKRKKASLPGQPPSSHVGTLKNLIFFGYDSATDSTVIGPASFKANAIVPWIHEYGGQKANKRSINPKATGRKATRAQAAAYRRKLKDGSLTAPQRITQMFLAKYPKRSYMRPALAAESPKFAHLFKG